MDRRAPNQQEVSLTRFLPVLRSRPSTTSARETMTAANVPALRIRLPVIPTTPLINSFVRSQYGSRAAQRSALTFASDTHTPNCQWPVH